MSEFRVVVQFKSTGLKACRTPRRLGAWQANPGSESTLAKTGFLFRPNVLPQIRRSTSLFGSCRSKETPRMFQVLHGYSRQFCQKLKRLGVRSRPDVLRESHRRAPIPNPSHAPPIVSGFEFPICTSLCIQCEGRNGICRKVRVDWQCQARSDPRWPQSDPGMRWVRVLTRTRPGRTGNQDYLCSLQVSRQTMILVVEFLSRKAVEGFEDGKAGGGGRKTEEASAER